MAQLSRPAVKFVSTEPLVGVPDPKPGFGGKRFFQIYQQKPIPMEPLLVWRGFHGNVYFEPLGINHASLNKKRVESRFPPLHMCSSLLSKVVEKSPCNAAHTMEERLKHSNRLEDARFVHNQLSQQTSQRRIFQVKRMRKPVARTDDLVEDTGTLRWRVKPKRQSR